MQSGKTFWLTETRERRRPGERVEKGFLGQGDDRNRPGVESRRYWLRGKSQRRSRGIYLDTAMGSFDSLVSPVAATTLPNIKVR